MIIYQHKISAGCFVTLSSQPDIHLIKTSQVHGYSVINKNIITNSSEADGIFFSDLNPPYPAILTADCIPILITGKNSFALIHAGWRGVHNQIALKCLAKIDPILLIIGPHIRKCCFEVTLPFKDNFPKSNYFSNKSNKTYFDLTEELKKQVRKIYPTLEIIDNGPCTCCNKDFHSYRRDKTDKRNWNLFVPSINIFSRIRNKD